MIAAANIKYLQQQIARHDDHFAYKEMFLAFHAPLLRFAITLVKSKEQAEEIVSDIFISIWQKRKRLESIANIKVYLFIAVKNAALNFLRAQNKDVTDSMDEASMDVKSIYFNPEELLVTAEMVALIKAAIEDLPPKCRLIFKLVKEEGLKYKEVAEVLSLSVKTVESQLAIALKKIASSIQFDISRSISASRKQHR